MDFLGAILSALAEGSARILGKDNEEKLGELMTVIVVLFIFLIIYVTFRHS